MWHASGHDDDINDYKNNETIRIMEMIKMTIMMYIRVMMMMTMMMSPIIVIKLIRLKHCSDINNDKNAYVNIG